MLDVSLFQAFFILCHSKLTLGDKIDIHIDAIITHDKKWGKQLTVCITFL